MKHETAQALRELLLAVGRGERDLEHLRQNLCYIYDFAPADAFKRLDANSNGQITADELHKYLYDNYSYYGCKSECAQLVNFFSSQPKADVLTLAE
jgi:hypothetical protein